MSTHTTSNPSNVRVRFAPSPTGYLHIGGVRTALFNWLFARHAGGAFLLRIEDTDLERSDAKYEDDILSCMKWLGLNWDEEIIRQRDRMPTYRAEAERLLRDGHAYVCTCTEEKVDAMRQKAMIAGKKPQYDRSCRDERHSLDGEGPRAVRVKIPLQGEVVFKDMIRGEIRFDNGELDDFVILRANGAPTYNFSVVVDDAGSRISHVIRGDDHVNNTPKQIHLYEFLGHSVPQFAHLPMIWGPDKKKLSKRHGDVSANWYRGEGYLPEAVLNFLVRLGWSHGDQEIFSMEEMVRHFGVEHVQKSPAVFNQEKLLWLAGNHLRGAEPARVSRILFEDFSDQISDAARPRVKTPLGAKLVALIQPKVKLIKEIVDQIAPLCLPGVVEVDPSILKWNQRPDQKAVAQSAIGALEAELARHVPDGARADRGLEDRVWGDCPSLGDLEFTPERLDEITRTICGMRGIKLGDIAEPIRLALTGRLISAGLFEILSVLPWDVAGARLRKIAEF